MLRRLRLDCLEDTAVAAGLRSRFTTTSICPACRQPHQHRPARVTSDMRARAAQIHDLVRTLPAGHTRALRNTLGQLRFLSTELVNDVRRTEATAHCRYCDHPDEKHAERIRAELNRLPVTEKAP